MQTFPKYVFYGGIFGVALATLALASIGTTEAGTVAFLSQPETNKTTPAELGQYQQLDCSTIEYDIHKAQLALSGPGLTSAQNVQLVFGRVSGKGAWDKLKRREVGKSDVVRFSSDSLETVTFSFDVPIESKTLCSSPDDMAYMRLEGVQEPGLYIHGSEADAYAGPLYNCVLDNGLPCTGTIIDMAFAFFTQPNTPPVIAQVGEKEVQELETLEFTLTATDGDGDAVTWGSGNLPEGATLDPVTGEFTWAPTSDQVQDYKITFVATDDGGPVQESSDITVFVRVVNIETPTESNELLEDTVVALEFENNIENSYLANIKNVEVFIEKGQQKAADNQLNILVKKVEQDYSKELITEKQYTTLTGEIDDLLENLEVE